MDKELKRVLKYAKRIAAYYGEERFSSVHVLLAACVSPDGRIGANFARHGLLADSLLETSPFLIEPTGEIMPVIEVELCDEELIPIVTELDSNITVYGFLSAVIRGAPKAGVSLEILGIDPEKLAMDLMTPPISVKITKADATPKKKKKPTMVETFCKDLTALAAEGLIDPVIGRKKEIKRMVQILGRRRKNNPAILGEPGVGKSALVEGLALAISKEEKFCKKLHGKRLLVLDLSQMLAGTKYRGEFEQRLTGLIKELEDAPNTITFLDELHMLVGTGDCEGASDAANMLKPALARGKLQMIGATTLHEYGTIKKDGALSRRFQPVVLEELSDDEVYAILKGIKHLYEDHHSVKYTEKALRRMVKLGRDVEGRHSPDVQIDIMDEAGASATRERICVPHIDATFEVQSADNQDKTKRMGF